MKRIAIVLCIAFAFASIGWGTYRAAAPAAQPLSKYIPEGPLLYLEAKNFSSLLNDWNASPQHREWVQSDNYEVFSRSRLFLRLKGASEQFAAAAGLPPDMNFLSQVSGEHSVFALYDIGKLEFLYITNLPGAKSMQTALWQSRATFEPRSAGGVTFYLRRDPESKREVAFAIAGDYLLLATREDLVAGALTLMSGQPERTVESEQWWGQSTGAAVRAGDLRMVLDLEKLVPNGYFRTYWAQQNITNLSQYSAAISDLFRESTQYREERVLVRKKEIENSASTAGLAAAAELAALAPDDAALYFAYANPTADSCFALLATKQLAPHLGPVPASQIAPQVQLTSGEQGGGSDLETRIDQVPPEHSTPQSVSALQELLRKTAIQASLQVQRTERDQAGVFVRIDSAAVLMAASEWNAAAVQSALTDFVTPSLTASQLGVGWQPKTGYQELAGLWPLTVAIRGKYVIVSDEPALMESILTRLGRKSDREPAIVLAGFNHARERANFKALVGLIDRPNASTQAIRGIDRQPEFFSGNVASLSETLSGVSAERIEVRNDGNKMRQMVLYEWSQ
jgi:hypothetical protein